jgi:hypothetical protein
MGSVPDGEAALTGQTRGGYPASDPSSDSGFGSADYPEKNVR